MLPEKRSSDQLCSVDSSEPKYTYIYLYIYVYTKYILLSHYSSRQRTSHPLVQSVETVHCADVRSVRYCRLAHPPCKPQPLPSIARGRKVQSRTSRVVYTLVIRDLLAHETVGATDGCDYIQWKGERVPDKADNESRSSILFPRLFV